MPPPPNSLLLEGEETVLFLPPGTVWGEYGEARRGVFSNNFAPSGLIYPVNQLVPAGNKFLDTFVLEHLDHIVIVDSDVAQPRQV